MSGEEFYVQGSGGWDDELVNQFFKYDPLLPYDPAFFIAKSAAHA